MVRSSAVAVGCWLLVGAAALATSPASAETEPPSISVEGEANADAVPDIARLDLSVVEQRPTATAATADLARVADAVMQAAKAAGIAPADITTAAVELSPVYPDQQPAGTPPTPRAFRAATTLHITVRPAERAGALASALVDKGANTIDGISYSASDAESRLDALRAEAARNARHRAEIYTAALGVRLGRVLDVSPAEQEMPRAMSMMPVRVAAKATLPTAPGRLPLRAAVRIRWAIEQ